MQTADNQDRNVEMVPLSNLILDPQNPRIPPAVRAKDEAGFIEYLLKSADVLELMDSIGSKGYFEGEPILVTKEGAPDGSYIVVEGNCRLTACKLLETPILSTKRRKVVTEIAENATETVNELPCVIYEKRSEILSYLGYRHVKGAHPWDALQKARYLEQLKESVKGQFEGSELYKQIARQIGSRSDYVAQLLTALTLYNNIQEKDYFDTGLTEEKVSFSLLSTSLSYSSICNFLGLENSRDVSAEGLEMNRLEQLTKWLFEENQGVTRLGESRNLKTLAAVVAHPKALERFEKGDALDEAQNWTHLPRETFLLSIEQAHESLKRAQEVIPRVDNTIQDDVDHLIEVNQLLRALGAQVRAKVKSDKDDFGDI